MLLHRWWVVLAFMPWPLSSAASFSASYSNWPTASARPHSPSRSPLAGGGERIQTEWAIHQVQTTVDFARGNRFLCWFLGGLNFQIEHHLFHKICHIHYPALSKVVEEACHEFGIRYAEHKTFFSAVASHFHWLVEMGRPIVAANQLPAV